MKKYTIEISIKFTKKQFKAIQLLAESYRIPETEFIRRRLTATQSNTVRPRKLKPLVAELNEVIKANKMYIKNNNVLKSLNKMEMMLTNHNSLEICNKDDGTFDKKINVPITLRQKESIYQKAEKAGLTISEYTRNKVFETKVVILKKDILPILEELNFSLKKCERGNCNSQARKVVRKIWNLI